MKRAISGSLAVATTSSKARVTVSGRSKLRARSLSTRRCLRRPWWARPTAARGQIVKAFVVLRKECGASDELRQELQEHCKRITAPYKYPREIEFLDELPKTISGKIRRVQLRDRA